MCVCERVCVGAYARARVYVCVCSNAFGVRANALVFCTRVCACACVRAVVTPDCALQCAEMERCTCCHVLGGTCQAHKRPRTAQEKASARERSNRSYLRRKNNSSRETGMAQVQGICQLGMRDLRGWKVLSRHSVDRLHQLRAVEGQPWVPDGSTVGPRFLGATVGSRTKIVNRGSPRPVFSFACAGQPDQIVNL